MLRSTGKHFLILIGPRSLIAIFALVSAALVGINSLSPRPAKAIPPRAVLRGHQREVHALAWAPDGTTLASAAGAHGESTEFKIWDVADGVEQASLWGHTGLIESVVFSPDGQMLAGSWADGTIELWDVGTHSLRSLLSRPGGHAPFRSVSSEVPFLAFCSNGKTLASAGRDHKVHLWNVVTGNEQAIFGVPQGWAYYLQFDAEGPVLVRWRADTSELSVWDVRQSKERAAIPIPPSPIRCVALSSDGQILAAGCYDGSLHLWDLASGRLRSTQQGHEAPVTSIALSRDDSLLASGARDGVVKLWQVSSLREVATMEGHTSAAGALAFSPQGNQIASGSSDQTVIVWRIP
jgi:WD40 repeat protein